MWKHEGYDSSIITNDVSLLKLDEPLQFNEYVQPLPMAPKGDDPAGEPSASTLDGDQLATAQPLRCQTSCSLWRCQLCPDRTARKIILVSTESTREGFALALMREVFLLAPVTVVDPLLALMRTEPCNCLALSPGE